VNIASVRIGGFKLVGLHVIYGLVILVLAVLLFIWNVLRLSNRVQGKSYRRLFLGLLDLQVLIGIVTFILHPMWGVFLFHPISMIIAVGIAHVLTKESRPARVQMIGYFVTTILLFFGAWIR